jgi:hypothetical protein
LKKYSFDSDKSFSTLDYDLEDDLKWPYTLLGKGPFDKRGFFSKGRREDSLSLSPFEEELTLIRGWPIDERAFFSGGDHHLSFWLVDCVCKCFIHKKSDLTIDFLFDTMVLIYIRDVVREFERPIMSMISSNVNGYYFNILPTKDIMITSLKFLDSIKANNVIYTNEEDD